MSKTTRTSKKIQIIDNNDEETKITQSRPIYEKIDLNSIKGGSVEKKQVIKDDIDALDVKNTQNIANNEELDNSNKIDFQSSLIHSPYIETSLRCPIMLNPTQMDNKLQLHLKSNLNNYTKGRCYLNYGYIIKINKIEEISDGRIEEEDSSCSAKFIVKFSCRLCLPAKNREIICKIDRMNKALISGVNGPIKAIITPDKINKDKFFTDTDRNIRIKSSSQILEPDTYIKVLILSSTFSHYDTNIIAISYLQDIATGPEVKLFEREQYLNQN